MKKYKLLKDLPGMKAGEILECGPITSMYNPANHPDFFEPVKEWPKSWEELGVVKGFWIGCEGELRETYGCSVIEYNKNVFTSKKYAASQLALAQLTQLAKAINGDWEPDWDDDSYKYVIKRCGNEIEIDYYCSSFYHIAFRSREAAEFSLQHHRKLWEDYFILSK